MDIQLEKGKKLHQDMKVMKMKISGKTECQYDSGKMLGYDT